MKNIVCGILVFISLMSCATTHKEEKTIEPVKKQEIAELEKKTIPEKFVDMRKILSTAYKAGRLENKAYQISWYNLDLLQEEYEKLLKNEVNWWDCERLKDIEESSSLSLAVLLNDNEELVHVSNSQETKQKIFRQLSEWLSVRIGAAAGFYGIKLQLA